MTEHFRNRLNMLDATLEHFDQHEALWQDKTVIADRVAAVRAGRDAMVEADRAKAANDPTAVTEQKRAARKRLEALLTALGQKAGSYAVIEDDTDLRRAVDHPKSTWARLPDAELLTDAEVAVEKTEPHLSALADYGVAESDLQAIRDAAEAFRPLSRRRANTQVDRTTAIGAIGEAYEDTLQPLALLDRLVPALIPNEAFTAEYERVRRILGE
jgi:hypothetical protein